MFLRTKKLLHISLILSIGLFFNGCGGGDTSPGIDTTMTWTDVFTDNFTRADGALGANYTTDVNINSTLGIVSNSAVYSATAASGSSADAYYNTSVNDTNSRVSIKFTTGSSLNIDRISINARWTTGSNDGYCYVIGCDGSSFSLLRFDDTSGEDLEIKNYTLQTNTTYIMEFAMVGSTLIGYLKDSGGTILSKVTATDATYSSGQVSFGAKGTAATTVTFDDFKIEKSI